MNIRHRIKRLLTFLKKIQYKNKNKIIKNISKKNNKVHIKVNF